MLVTPLDCSYNRNLGLRPCIPVVFPFKELGMKKVLILMAVVVFVAISAVAQDTAGQKTIKDQAEYNAYVAAINTADAAQRGAALESFLATYPNSIMKPDALALALRAYQQAGNARRTNDIAQKLFDTDPGNIDAPTVLCYNKISTAQTEQDVKDASSVCQRGMAILDNIKKADGETDVAFAQRKQ